ncbi:PEGA domain-containing protein [Natranaerovirga hydrolytica]|uniref:PEGA domain-containing protein n=1 Tax=Natranaerovirga hydrolytica TaxID=680378 RepID=A0A4R1MRT0_9FIRM|nr:PEGA domain-containing protein [Natranaerovirga hydrolytica]TCK93279.1 PEGA domain-containing protein [Natranaerovirga hydrolytica]
MKTNATTKMFIFIGIILTSLLVLSGCGSNNNSNANNTRNNHTEDQDTQEERRNEYIRTLGVIRNVDTVNRRLSIYDIENEELITLNIDGAVNLEDKFGEQITLQQFKLGHMVRTKFEVESRMPEYVQITAQTWEYRRVLNLDIDTEAMTIKRGNDTFNYTDELLVLSNGIPIEITDITPHDELTLKGYRDKVWVVNLDNGHGFIDLRNHDYFINGTIEIGSNIMEIITEKTKIPVPVGVHRIIIDKNNIEPIVKELMVEKDQNVILDLSDEVPKEGTITFDMVQEDVDLYINGQRYEDIDSPKTLPFGNYLIVAQKEGYQRYERSIDFNSPELTHRINLEQELKYLHVNSPSNVELYLEGDYIGIIPVSVPIEPGNYGITLRKDGHYSKLYNIEILDNGQDSFFTFPELESMNN